MQVTWGIECCEQLLKFSITIWGFLIQRHTCSTDFFDTWLMARR